MRQRDGSGWTDDNEDDEGNNEDEEEANDDNDKQEEEEEEEEEENERDGSGERERRRLCDGEEVESYEDEDGDEEDGDNDDDEDEEDEEEADDFSASGFKTSNPARATNKEKCRETQELNAKCGRCERRGGGGGGGREKDREGRRKGRKRRRVFRVSVCGGGGRGFANLSSETTQVHCSLQPPLPTKSHALHNSPPNIGPFPIDHVDMHVPNMQQAHQEIV